MAPTYLVRSPLPGSATLVIHPTQSHSSDSLAALVSRALSVPESSLRLSRNGRPWDGLARDEDMDDAREWIEVDAAMRVRGGAPKKRCQQGKGSATETQCPSPALRLVGDCTHCALQFCARHRLPEDHACSQMSSCREAAFERNKAKLESERTVGSKMVGA